jgi:AbrB family looped-hinge helix DNA binding protein
MQSTITSKYQTTIPKRIRDNLGLSIKDSIEWKLEGGRAVVYPSKLNFLEYKNRIKTGKGSIDEDIEAAHKIRGKENS